MLMGKLYTSSGLHVPNQFISAVRSNGVSQRTAFTFTSEKTRGILTIVSFRFHFNHFQPYKLRYIRFFDNVGGNPLDRLPNMRWFK